MYLVCVYHYRIYIGRAHSLLKPGAAILAIYIQLKVNIIYTTLNCNEDHAWWYRVASVYHYVIGFSVIDF